MYANSVKWQKKYDLVWVWFIKTVCNVTYFAASVLEATLKERKVGSSVSLISFQGQVAILKMLQHYKMQKMVHTL